MFNDSGLFTKRHMKTYVFSPENPTGMPGCGSKGEYWQKLHPCDVLEAGETKTLVNTNGPGIIRTMWFTGDVSQSLVLRIYWDGQEHPSVEAPLGSFFGYGFPDITSDRDNRFPTLNSAMFLAAPCRGMNCYWPMPFLRNCRITLENRRPDTQLTVFYTITMEKGQLPEEVLYFHASYRQAFPVTRHQAYTVIDGIQGEGHFAGVTLAVGTNAPNGCWVEGEAKMYIDGDIYPSVNYTGTEDYFCGAYAFGYDRGAHTAYQPYSGLYAGMYAVLGSQEQRYQYQPRFMLYRLHVPDPISFEKDFRMSLQNMEFTPYGQRGRRDDFSSCAYWYQTLPSAPLLPLPADEDIFTR